MRKVIAAMVMVATLASPALAQRLPPPSVVAAHGGWSGGPVGAPSLPRGPGPRWGGTVGGRWWGGMQAPGGWHAYRRPARGFVLPSYWLGGDFVITDFVDFGLDTPPYGYHWARYYDDAVLIDDNGQVWDSVHGLDWDRLDRIAPPPQPVVYQGAGRDDRYDDYGRGADYGRPPVVIQPQAQGYTQTFVAGSGGSYTVPGGVTTITIESAPVVTTTTTTTEYVESYGGRRVVRHAYRPRHAARRCCCCCR
ncbi:RcnB family protein [Sphingomonas sp. GlSt437]|uniref:RcnB family protein n=1 Tax=Sphingomonas sp. GlSt437 TaxID=3389970 RepID=UPI003A860DF1